MRERLLEIARKKGVELSERETESILRDLRRWVNHNISHDILAKTADGSYTLISKSYGEPYHSITAGAVVECLEKFVRPSEILQRALFRKEVKILDVGFGLGYNIAVAVHEIRRKDPGTDIVIASLEKNLLSDIFVLPEPYRDIHRKILSLLPEGESEGIYLRVLTGDAREKIASLRGFEADAVFHDAFSPYRNPELWSLEFLKLVKECMNEEGIWVSYTSSLPVRKALLNLGFSIGSTKPVGRKRGGTVATLKGRVNPITEEERKKLLTSPYSVPFRDPNLRSSSIDILIDYRLNVLLRARVLSSAGKTTRQIQTS